MPETYAHPFTGCKCTEIHHKSGLTVRICEQPAFHTAFMQLTVRFGSLDTCYRADGREYRLPAGTAHFLEHQLFENKDIHAMSAFTALGASSNACTGNRFTSYYADTAQSPYEVLALLLKTVQEPQFTPKTVRKERGIITHELRLQLDSPFYETFQQMRAFRYPGHPICDETVGTMETISDMTADTLMQAYRHWYTPQNMLLSCAGNITAEGVMETVDRMVAACPQAAAESILPPVSMTPAQSCLHLTDGLIAKPVTVLLYTVDTAHDPPQERLRKNIYSQLAYDLILGEASLFTERLVSERHLLSDLTQTVVSYPGFLETSILANAIADADAFCEAVFREMERTAKDGLDSEMFRIAKRSAYANACASQNTPEQIVGIMDGAWQSGVPPFTAVRLFTECTQDAVQAMLPTLFPQPQCLRVFIQPDEDTPS